MQHKSWGSSLGFLRVAASSNPPFQRERKNFTISRNPSGAVAFEIPVAE
jgi:hypothetical protein